MWEPVLCLLRKTDLQLCGLTHFAFMHRVQAKFSVKAQFSSQDSVSLLSRLFLPKLFYSCQYTAGGN